MDFFTPQAPAPPERMLSVSQLTRRIRDVVESGFRNVWVEGEISNCRRQASGHTYFTLKDATAQLACVLFKGNAATVRSPLTDGAAVQLMGDLSVYEARGQYQLIVRRVQHAGAGSLQARFEALKRRLAEEGLFDSERKRPIPAIPRTVAIVTSPTGAAIQDMLNVLTRRAPWLHILIAPVRVQGQGAAEEIAAALRLLGSASGRSLPRIDTIVAARGGGSIEDLWAFNEEVVARAIHASPVPVISAVGHEIDFTIADFVADLRAPTPSAAAELLAPDRAELLAGLDALGRRLHRRAVAVIDNARRVITLTARGALQREPERLLLPWRQRLDAAADALEAAARQQLAAAADRHRALAHRLDLRRPDKILGERRAALAMAAERLRARSSTRTERLRAELSRLSGLLRTLGPESTLARGFTCTLDAAGHVVRRPDQLRPGDTFRTRFRTGSVTGVVSSVEQLPPQAKS